MPRAGFEPATPATKRPLTYALDRAATGISKRSLYRWEIWTSVVRLGATSVLMRHLTRPAKLFDNLLPVIIRAFVLFTQKA
jgi:hypothetical protein